MIFNLFCISQLDFDFWFESNINYLENWSSIVAYRSYGYRLELAKATSPLDVVRHYSQVTAHELEIDMFSAGAFLHRVFTLTGHGKFGVCMCVDTQ